MELWRLRPGRSLKRDDLWHPRLWDMYVFDIDAVRGALEAMDSNWKEFMRAGAFSAGVYRLKAGEPDKQKPHTEDEIYFVTRGRARFASGENVQDIAAGSVIYVEAHREHRFEDVVEDLEVLVIFSPPEGSSRASE